MTRASNDPERWAAIERLYHAALEREPDQRESFLFEACRDNEAVRQEVLSLLRYDAPEGRFLQGSPMEAAARMSASSTALSGWTLGAPVQCPSCSTEVPRESRFCLSCGEAISPSPQMPAAGPVRRLISSDSIPAGGFTPGAILGGRYRIIGLLGRGGMGEVYRADDLKLGQTVALKFLPAALASDPVRRERFFAEVRITRQLSHPNICRVYDIAEFEGRHFLSMEYIDGEDLA
jgi:hypothetical protein